MNEDLADANTHTAARSASESSSVTHESRANNSNRSTTPEGTEFERYIMSGWGASEEPHVTRSESALFARRRRDTLAAKFAGQRIVVGAGVMKQRSNDTFFSFRANSAFVYLTGWGAAALPGSVLVIDLRDYGDDEGELFDTEHGTTLYFRERAGKDSTEFFADTEVGEFWVGARPTLDQVAQLLSIDTAPLKELTLTDADRCVGIAQHSGGHTDDPELLQVLSEMRLVKDEYELSQLEHAVNATARGFDDIVASLHSAKQSARGERVVEAAFFQRARVEGNGVGYETISASGSHACTLHWVENTGVISDGQLLLVDAGVELDSLYTADITRTLPVSGTFTEAQRMVYEAVLEAADAAFAVVKPGVRFGDVHDAAMRVIEAKTRGWGLLPEQSSASQVAYHRRFMVHGTSHHLGIDVHDCADARREHYLDGVLKSGMVFTIEPGLYFHVNDLTVTEEFRGIGVRIEDDIVVTNDGARMLSAHIPRTVADVEQWVRAGLSAHS